VAVWAGVDVGAQRKGFHVAAVDGRRVVHGPVNVVSVAAATELLESLGLQDRPSRRLSQDDRDAIAAAWTARLCTLPGAIEWFGEIAVPEGHS
jgi:hypothetical protein